MKKLLLFLLLPFSLFGQKHDNVWLFGYNSSGFFEGAEGIIRNFSDEEPSFDYIPMLYDFNNGSTIISDKEGELSFYFNGCVVFNAVHEIMLNGNGINPGEVSDEKCPERYTSGSQSSLILPMPDSDSIYYIFHKRIIYEYNPNFDVITDKLLLTTVNTNLDNGLGGVELKNQELWTEPQTYGEITAIKHANGEDWWVVSMTDQLNEYLFFLLTHEGVSFHHSQILGNEPTYDGSRGAVTAFSPNGSKFTRFNPTDGIYLFDFDRTEGMLSNFQHISIDDGAFAGGAVISPNSRFLYIPTDLNLYQFDLEAEDIAASQILIDTFDGYTSPFTTTFYLGQLAPDCKIYINSFATVDVLHVIHNPDELGTDCNFEQHAIQLPFNHLRSLPHFPNYRLGPLIEGEEPLPPCELVVDVEEMAPKAQEPSLYIYPNPAYDVIQLEAHSALEKEITYQIIDSFGRALEQGSFLQSKELNISPYPPGIYYCQIKKGQNIIDSKRFVIIR